MDQNLRSLQNLDEMAITLKADHVSTHIPKAFDLKKRILSIGQWVDVKDTADTWVEYCNAA